MNATTNWLLLRGLAREQRHWEDFPAILERTLPGTRVHRLDLPGQLAAIAALGTLAGALIGAVRDQGRVKEDAAIGIVFTTLFALGLVLISVTPSQTDLNHIIFRFLERRERIEQFSAEEREHCLQRNENTLPSFRSSSCEPRAR